MIKPSICKSLIKTIPIPRRPTKPTPFFCQSRNFTFERFVVFEFVQEDRDGEKGTDEGDVFGVRVGDFLGECGDLFVGEVGEVGREVCAGSLGG